ncbi:hypothetical protein Tco_1196193 [Tanacetum coccineum]
MTRSTIKRLTKPLDEPEREFQRLRRVALQSHQNESLAIAERNLFDDDASSSNKTGPKPPTPPKTLREHSHPTSSGFQNPITGLRTEDPLCYVKHYLSIIDNIQADGATKDTSRLRFFHFSLKGKAAEWLDRIPYNQIKEVNANCILMANLQQASTSGTQTDKAPIYDSDGSAKVHEYDNCYNNEIFTQEEHVEHSGGTVEQHPATIEETRAYFESLYNNLVTEVEKVNTVNRKMKEMNTDLTTELVRYRVSAAGTKVTTVGVKVTTA